MTKVNRTLKAGSKRPTKTCSEPVADWDLDGIIPRLLLVISITFFWSILVSAGMAATLTGNAEIVDGDTIKVGGLAVRLYGIDAPEGRQTCQREGNTYACGTEATRTLVKLIGGRTVECDVVGKDNYGRILGVCRAGETDLNATMVSQGWALAFVKYSDRYTQLQQTAEIAKVGLWAGSFIPPWDWRVSETQAAEKTRSCVIKGNINVKGEHIYHLPFQQFYTRTKIDERKGERWFCTEQEAIEAGWRRALR
jgi:endonuclease YncB( thermonuclease family)